MRKCRLLGTCAESRSPLSYSVVVLLREQLVDVVHGRGRPVLVVAELARLLLSEEHVVLRLGRGATARLDVGQQLAVVVRNLAATTASVCAAKVPGLVLVKVLEDSIDGIIVRIIITR